MLEGGIVILFLSLLLFTPIAWRAVHDRREQRALVVAATMRHVLVQALGGESFVAVEVKPPGIWRSGRVVLSVPADWRPFLDRVWPAVLAQLPVGYELVVQQRPAAEVPAAAA